MSKIDDIYKSYELEIEAWHLFYESFLQYDISIQSANGILVSMMVEVNKAKKRNAGSEKILESEKRINHLFEIIDSFTGLNNKCSRLQTQLKKSKSENLELLQEIELLTSELNAIKSAIHGEDENY